MPDAPTTLEQALERAISEALDTAYTAEGLTVQIDTFWDQQETREPSFPLTEINAGVFGNEGLTGIRTGNPTIRLVTSAPDDRTREDLRKMKKAADSIMGQISLPAPYSNNPCTIYIGQPGNTGIDENAQEATLNLTLKLCGA